jgi:hypothetical protein
LAVKENGITEHIMSRESDFLQNSIIKITEPRGVEMVGEKLYTRLVVVLPTVHAFGMSFDRQDFRFYCAGGINRNSDSVSRLLFGVKSAIYFLPLVGDKSFM